MHGKMSLPQLYYVNIVTILMIMVIIELLFYTVVIKYEKNAIRYHAFWRI